MQLLMAVRLLKAKLQRKRKLRLIITQQEVGLTMYAKILRVTQYITYHDTCMMSCTMHLSQEYCSS